MPVEELGKSTIFSFREKNPESWIFDGNLSRQNLPMYGNPKTMTSYSYEPGQSCATFNASETIDWSVTLSNNAAEQLKVGYDKARQRYYLDRSRSGNVNFSPGFKPIVYAPRIAQTKATRFNLVIDLSSVELFADDGLTCLTGVFCPSSPLGKIDFEATSTPYQGNLRLDNVGSIWQPNSGKIEAVFDNRQRP